MADIYKILSLDGGGAWSLIQVQALIDLFGAAAPGRTVLSDFDLVVANSGGSLVLGGLLENKPLSAILDDFMDETLRRSVFQPTDRIVDGALHQLLGFGPQFSAKKKLPAVRDLLPSCGGQTLPQIAAGLVGAAGNRLHILIPSFDFDRNIAVFFRSGPSGGPEWGDGAASLDATLAEAIHASSNAPVQFFDEPASWNADRYWDGAIAGCNNPVLAGVAEAITLQVSPQTIRALAIGTGTVRSPGPPADDPPPFLCERSAQGLLADLKKLAASITDDPPDASSFLAHIMTGGAQGLPRNAVSHIVRLNPMVSPVSDGQGGWRPPGAWTPAQLAHLAAIDLAAPSQVDAQYIADYGDLWISGNAPNQPLRMDADTLQSKLGAQSYPDAVAEWRLITA